MRDIYDHSRPSRQTVRVRPDRSWQPWITPFKGMVYGLVMDKVEALTEEGRFHPALELGSTYIILDGARALNLKHVTRVVG